MFGRILVATDSVDACDAAVFTAAWMADQNKATLYILHVLESAYSGKYRQFVKHFETGEEIVSDAEYKEKVKEHIEKSCSDVLKLLPGYEIQVAAGFPWEQILRLARRERIDLIVLGPHSQRAEAKGVVRVAGTIGSTVEGVILHERCPVLIANVTPAEEQLVFKKVMVCVDFSESCRSALELSTELAQEYRAKICLFHMVIVPASLKYPQDELERDLAASKKQLEAFSKNIPGTIAYECGVWEGIQPHLEILKYAREKGVDLIVMGSHTKEKHDKWYVGSAVEQVSSRSRCPVVVVTDPKVVVQVSL